MRGASVTWQEGRVQLKVDQAELEPAEAVDLARLLLLAARQAEERRHDEAGGRRGVTRSLCEHAPNDPEGGACDNR